MDIWKRCGCEAAMAGKKNHNNMKSELVRRGRLQETRSRNGGRERGD
jgi:hypothetical protein